MALGFIKSFIPNLDPLFPYYVLSLIGGIFGYGIIWGIIFFYKQVKKKEGMGLGDAKLLAVIGFWFGLDAVPFIIFLSSTINQPNQSLFISQGSSPPFYSTKLLISTVTNFYL